MEYNFYTDFLEICKTNAKNMSIGGIEWMS